MHRPDSRQKINKATQEIFVKNYYKQYLLSTGCYILVLGSALVSLFQYSLTCSNSALTWIKIATVIGAIWFLRSNDPKTLAKKACYAIENNEPDKAIEFIQQGADIDWKFVESRGSGQLFPFLPFYWYPGLAVSLIEKAALHDSSKVCSHLVSIGFKLDHTRVLNMLNDLEIIKFFILSGMPVEIDPKAFYCLEPYVFLTLPWRINQLRSLIRKGAADQEIKQCFTIANYLSKNGAQPGEDPDNIENWWINKIRETPIGSEDKVFTLIKESTKVFDLY